MARFLVDTHALIWWWDEDARLSDAAQRMMADRSNEISVPCVCAWEIANKVRIGKLPQMAPYIDDYDALVRADGFRHIDLRYDHALRAGQMPGDHRDPFDRLIAALSLADDAPVITRDRELAALGCRTLW